ncbi:hypothetical protein [Nocardia concava]|uniref:hypothetical protein n=1 Tax=Nocardia concava TaxID=257281 RepID=UPI0006876414|nr:hypothetical protein [Nocardia concava]
MVAITKYFLHGNQYETRGWLLWTTVCLLVSILAAAAIYHGVDKPITTRFPRRTNMATLGGSQRPQGLNE